MKMKLFLSMILCGFLASIVGANAAEDDDQAVAVKDLPAAVVKTAMRVFPTGKITEAETETEKGQTMFEVEVTVGDKEYEVEITSDGTLIKVQLEDDDDEHDADDEHGEKEEHDDD